MNELPYSLPLALSFLCIMRVFKPYLSHESSQINLHTTPSKAHAVSYPSFCLAFFVYSLRQRSHFKVYFTTNAQCTSQWPMIVTVRLKIPYIIFILNMCTHIIHTLILAIGLNISIKTGNQTSVMVLHIGFLFLCSSM